LSPSDIVAPPPAAWVDTYLKLLGLQREPPTLEHLRKLNRAHVMRVPFENISSIVRRAAAGGRPVPPVDREAELQAWADHRGGGVCFEVVDMLDELLSGLGYKTHVVLATISFVGSHQANLVELGGARYLVDAGNGAPFFEPILLSELPVELGHVGLRYRFRGGESPDTWIQDRRIGSAWRPFCTYDLSPASDADRAEAYRRHHTPGQSWVVDTLTLVRSTASVVWALRDNRLTHHTAGGKTISKVDSAAECQRVVAEIFELPSAPTAQALAALAQRS
jgi:N-hydroxyarylamine O-acetyltransferase